MYQFPKDLYTDIRIETAYSTNILLENFQLRQNKERTNRGAMIRIFDGQRWYYNSTTELDNLQQQINNLAKMATPNPDIYNHPIIKKLEVNKDICLKFNEVDISKVDNKKKLDLLYTYVPVLKEKEEVKMSNMYYIDRHIVKRIVSSKGTDITFDNQNCFIVLRYNLQINNIPYEGLENICELRFEDLFNKEDYFRQQLKTDIAFCEEAVPVKPGIYTCILSPETTGIFAHESFGHKSESDFMVGNETQIKEWAIGKKVGTDGLSIIDSGLHEGTGYVPYDDEGCRAKENYIIKDGILTGRLHSGFTAASLNEEQTGNARAINFENEPIVRMTTTYIAAGKETKDELITNTEEGIYIEKLNHGSGMTTFTLAPRRAYMIKGGRLAEPVRISVITGNVMKTLFEIDGLSNEIELFSFALGGCGKMYQQGLPVAYGGPYIRVKGINVQ